MNSGGQGNDTSIFGDFSRHNVATFFMLQPLMHPCNRRPSMATGNSKSSKTPCQLEPRFFQASLKTGSYVNGAYQEIGVNRFLTRFLFS